MNGETLRWVLIWSCAGAFSIWFLASLFFRVAGEWVRVHAPGQAAGDPREERFHLSQFGPYVSGRWDVPGGHQTYQGLIVGRTLHLRRRDFGRRYLEGLGFPPEIARRLEGQVFARFELKLLDNGEFLDGAIYPRRIEFTHQPPRVTGIYHAQSAPRAYRRVEMLPVPEVADAWTDEISAPSTRG